MVSNNVSLPPTPNATSQKKRQQTENSARMHSIKGNKNVKNIARMHSIKGNKKRNMNSSILWPYTSICPSYFRSELYNFEVRLELYDRLTVSPPLSSSHPPTPPPSRWPALTTLAPLPKFQLVWSRLCEALRSFSSLAGLRPVSAASSSLKCREYKARFPWAWILNRSLYMRTWTRSKRRSL